MLAFIFIVAVTVIIVIAVKNLDPSSQSESTPTSNKSWEERFIEAARNNQNDLARKILRKGAEAGDIYCMETLALYYSSEIQSGAKYGILPNSALSIFWYRRAADAGSASAMMFLSYAYSLGEGVEVDEDKAIGCLKKALKTDKDYDFASAASWLGHIYGSQKTIAINDGKRISVDNPYYNPKRAAYSYVVAYYADSDYNMDAAAKARESGYSISDEELRSWANDGRNLRYNFNI